MNGPILVTGGTGTLGRPVVRLLTEADTGSRVRVLSRGQRAPIAGQEHVVADLLDGTSLNAALDGVGTVVHLAGGPKGDDVATANLANAAARAGVDHLVFVSVIGVDQVPLAWMRSKLAAEHAVVGSGVPWTILRAAQFHDLVVTMVRSTTRLPVAPVPRGMRFEPVDVRDVAARVAALTPASPAGRVADLAGPEVVQVGDLMRSYLDHVGKRRLLLPVRIPGKAGAAYRSGANLADAGADRGTLTWSQHLTDEVDAVV